MAFLKKKRPKSSLSFFLKWSLLFEEEEEEEEVGVSGAICRSICIRLNSRLDGRGLGADSPYPVILL